MSRVFKDDGNEERRSQSLPELDQDASRKDGQASPGFPGPSALVKRGEHGDGLYEAPGFGDGIFAGEAGEVSAEPDAVLGAWDEGGVGETEERQRGRWGVPVICSGKVSL